MKSDVKRPGVPRCGDNEDGDGLESMARLYRSLWSRLGGRPWTYILRDTWHRLEGLWIIGLVAAGGLLGRWLWDMVFWLLLAFALGYIAGHLFWGTRYVPGQKGNPTGERKGQCGS